MTKSPTVLKCHDLDCVQSQKWYKIGKKGELAMKSNLLEEDRHIDTQYICTFLKIYFDDWFLFVLQTFYKNNKIYFSTLLTTNTYCCKIYWSKNAEVTLYAILLYSTDVPRLIWLMSIALYRNRDTQNFFIYLFQLRYPIE